MPSPVATEPHLDDADRHVKQFEEAWLRSGPAAVEAFVPPADDPIYAAAVRELIRVDLEYGWEYGQPRSVEDYRRSFPDVLGDPAALAAVAFEEYRQRREHGDNPAPVEYARKYCIDTSDWPAAGGAKVTSDATGAAASPFYGTRDGRLDRDVPTQVTAAVHLLPAVHESSLSVAPSLADVALPKVGEQFLNFRLEAELGRGSFGRDFIARDLDLAERPVALKLTADGSDRGQTLAQLWHPHLEPLIERRRHGPLQAVVMPYQGRTTLADVIRGLPADSLPASGRHFVSTLNDGKVATLKGNSTSASA